MELSFKEFLMAVFRLLLLIGTVIAVFNIVTMFYETSYGIWLSIHHGLIIVSLLIAGLLGYRCGKLSFRGSTWY